jgi:hypothetical protein
MFEKHFPVFNISEIHSIKFGGEKKRKKEVILPF